MERTIEEKMDYLIKEFSILKVQMKGVKQQLKEVLNKGATKYQKEKWMEEIINNYIKKRSEVK